MTWRTPVHFPVEDLQEASKLLNTKCEHCGRVWTMTALAERYGYVRNTFSRHLLNFMEKIYGRSKDH